MLCELLWICFHFQPRVIYQKLSNSEEFDFVVILKFHKLWMIFLKKMFVQFGFKQPLPRMQFNEKLYKKMFLTLKKNL